MKKLLFVLILVSLVFAQNPGAYIGTLKLENASTVSMQCQEIFMDCNANSTDQTVAAESLNVAPPITCTLSAQPDVPRNISITVTDGNVSISAFDIDVLGINAEGAAKIENFLFAGGLVQVGNIAFATITSVTVNSITGADAGDVLDVGVGSKLGISNNILLTGDVYKVKIGSADYALADYTTSVTYNTVDVSTGGALGAYSEVTIWYKITLNVVY